MAQPYYQRDPYQGWSIINGGVSNMTAHELMSDTSGRWRCLFSMPGFRIYQYCNNQP